MTIMAPPSGLNPWPRSYEFQSFVRELRGRHNDSFDLSQISMVVEYKIFLRFRTFLLYGFIGPAYM